MVDFLPIPDTGAKKAPDSGSAILLQSKLRDVSGGVGETAVGSLETQQLQDWPGRGHALADPISTATFLHT
jgi:hypothetical protein